MKDSDDRFSIVVRVAGAGPARLASPSQARHVSPRGRALLLPLLVMHTRRVHSRERGVRALTNRAVLVGLAPRRHASNLAQREVRIRALALSDASTGVRERAAVSDADVVAVVVHLELDVVVVVVVAGRLRGGGRRSRPRRIPSVPSVFSGFLFPRRGFSASHLCVPPRGPAPPRPAPRPRLLRAVPREETGDGHVVVRLRRRGAVRSFPTSEEAGDGHVVVRGVR
mmetsp:Transcript_13531/g.54695  ORF Transcript_13531/g.54695 Transcript_13531/m.54695 type:complete len:226 (-) Transcript_13531:688-1365(-)